MSNETEIMTLCFKAGEHRRKPAMYPVVRSSDIEKIGLYPKVWANKFLIVRRHTQETASE